jgi:hypothetical protein
MISTFTVGVNCNLTVNTAMLAVTLKKLTNCWYIDCDLFVSFRCYYCSIIYGLQKAGTDKDNGGSDGFVRHSMREEGNGNSSNRNKDLIDRLKKEVGTE